jgi:hypothetical protein
VYIGLGERKIARKCLKNYYHILMKIGRKACYNANMNGEYTVYLVSGKLVRLKKDSVPTVFPDFPKSMQPSEPKKRRAVKRAASLPPTKSKRRKIGEIREVIQNDHSYFSTEEKVSNKLKESEEKIKNMRKKLIAVKIKNKKLQKTVTDLQNMLPIIKSKFCVQEPVIDILRQASSEIPEALFTRLTRNLKSKHNSRAEYPTGLQTFALTLHFHSPKAYR